MIDTQTNNYLHELASQSADSWFVYRLMGFNRRNDDGSHRQKYIRRCKPLDPLKLISAPTSSDPDAVGVADAKGRQLGHLDRRLASQIRAAIKSGVQFELRVAAQWRDPHGDHCLVAAILQLKPGLRPSHERSKARVRTAAVPSPRLPRRLGAFAEFVVGRAGRRTQNAASCVPAIG